MLPGVYQAFKKNGIKYYRSSITYRNKHISLGSYPSESAASEAYLLAGSLLEDFRYEIEDYSEDHPLSFHKWVVLINFRDNQIYFKNPIYFRKRYFFYYIYYNTRLRFDAEDLFYYAHHKIIRRGSHLFVSDYGMQVNILSRYGIKSYAVAGKDFIFVNGDINDYSYHIIEVINRYYGVSRILIKGHTLYLAKIHINGDYLIGRYTTETEAAIAYNKAALLLRNKGLKKNFSQNFIDGLDEIAYAKMFQKIRISKKLLSYADNLQNSPK